MAERYAAKQFNTMREGFEALDWVTVPKMLAQAAADAEIVEALVAMQERIGAAVAREEILSGGRSPELDVLESVAALVSQVPR
jgi:hypothetical protein